MPSLMSEIGGGARQPPRNSVVASAETVNMLMYSARKNNANFIERVLGVEPAGQLALALGEVERQPVGLADHRDDVDDEREQAGQDVPERGLRRHDLRGRHRPGVDEHGDQREAHRDLVGDHLRGRAQRAEQRVRRAGRPAGEHDAVDADGGDREDEQHGDREVGELQRGQVAEHRDRRPNGMTAKETKAIVAAIIGATMKTSLVGRRRGDVLLEHRLHAVGERLQQAERAGAVGAGTLLHPADDAALEPDHEERADQQEDEDQRRP